MNISVIGIGKYGLAITYLLSKNPNNNIKVWSHSPEKVEEYNNTQKLKSIYDVSLKKQIIVSNNLEEVLENTDIIYVVVSSKYFLNIIKNINIYYKKNTPICIATKGIEESKLELLSETTKKIINTKTIGIISGPSFAIDIINDQPIALTHGTRNFKTKNLVLKSLTSQHCKIRTTKDVEGVQLAGAIKNVVAIGSGIINGLGYSESTQAFYITESMHDIKNAMRYINGKKKTILSYAGVGDLLLTCTCYKSRNFSFGNVVGNAKNKKEIADFLKENTVEGYTTLKSMIKLINKKNMDFPIINILYEIIYQNKNPKILIEFLNTKK